MSERSKGSGTWQLWVVVEYDPVTRVPRADAGQPLSPASVHHIHAVLSTALEHAVKWGDPAFWRQPIELPLPR
jgi:hypothetical protein